jgi:hypothetical protein
MVPTATQNDGPVHDTALNHSGVPELGMVTVLTEEPFHVAAKMPGFIPCRPTAAQNVDIGHEIPLTAKLVDWVPGSGADPCQFIVAVIGAEAPASTPSIGARPARVPTRHEAIVTDATKNRRPASSPRKRCN